MAQRQLISCLRRARKPFFSSTLMCGHLRFFNESASPSIAHKRITGIPNDPWFSKVGNKFFSAASNPSQRQAGGKSAHSSEKVTSASQKQSSGKSTPPPPTTPKVSQSQKEGEIPSIPPRRWSPSYFLIVGACSALVIGLLTLYPTDLLKNLNPGQKEEESTENLLKDNKRNSKDATLLRTQNSDVKEQEGTLNDLKFLPAAEKQEFAKKGFGKDKEDAEDRGSEHTERADHLNSIDQHINSSFQEESQISESDEQVLPAHHADVHEEPPTVSINELSPKAQVSQSNEQAVPAEDAPSTVLLKQAKNNQVQVNSGDVVKSLSDSFMLLPSINKEPETLSEESVHEVLPKSSQEASNGETKRPSLFEAYYLPNGDGNNINILRKEVVTEAEDESSSLKHEVGEKSPDIKGTDLADGVHRETVRSAFDLLEIVHAAEQRQAEMDAHLHEEAQKKLKQAFQQELKDALAKEIMYAEEANRLAKEIEIERESGAVALKLEKEKASERLHRELEHKEEEINLKLKKAALLTKAQLAAAIAQEKSAYLKDVKDVKQELEALHMAFYTRSEEVRQSHTVHKLAVGTFALEDAMKRGAPIEKEVSLILSSYGGSGSDPLLDAAISSLPKEIVKEGTKTPAQLHQKFETMKGGLLELSLIPASGGGFLSHAAAKVVSILKVREGGHYSDGIEAIVSQVQRCLADGKLAEAADLLEKSVQGTEAEALVVDWVKNARDRAVMEQVLLVLQAHATAVASSLA